jgi:hypothetical protein
MLFYFILFTEVKDISQVNLQYSDADINNEIENDLKKGRYFSAFKKSKQKFSVIDEINLKELREKPRYYEKDFSKEFNDVEFFFFFLLILL